MEYLINFIYFYMECLLNFLDFVDFLLLFVDFLVLRLEFFLLFIKVDLCLEFPTL